MDPEAERETTFIELSSHQTGVPNTISHIGKRFGGQRLGANTDLTCVVWLIESANATVQQMIESFAHHRPSARVKTRWQYNNIAYSTASHLPEQLFGETFDDLVRDNVWEPLGMIQSYYNIQSARSTSRLANGFGRRLSVGLSAVQDVWACLRYACERHGVLSDGC